MIENLPWAEIRQTKAKTKTNVKKDFILEMF